MSYNFATSSADETKTNSNKQLKHIIMNKILVIATCVGALVLTSCKSVCYQVYNVVAPEATSSETDIKYVYEDITVSYNFWSNGGEPGFTITNNSDKIVNVDLTKSFFVLNGTSYDYFIDREYTSVVTGGVTAAYWGLLKSASIGSSQTIRSKKVVSIPPKASRFISEYTIVRTAYDACELSIKDFGELEFTNTNSPIRFSNVITYLKDGSETCTITNSFYVSRIVNIERRKERLTETVQDCKGRKIKVDIMKDQSPSAFYLQYERLVDNREK